MRRTPGQVRPAAGAMAAAVMGLVKGRPVHLALSGTPMAFDGTAKCAAGRP